MKKSFLLSTLLLTLALSSSSCVLKSTHDETLASYTQAASTLDQLKSENKRLVLQLAELQKNTSDHSTRNEELSQMNQMLTAKNKQLTEQILDLQKEIQKLKMTPSTPPGL